MKKTFLLILLLTLISCSDKNDKSTDDNLDFQISKAKVSEFNELYFVGIYSGLPSIYRYDAKSKKIQVFWSHKDERVFELLVSDDRQTAYFITKRKQRLKSSKPAIERGQLYRIDLATRKVERLTQLEEGIQIIPFWTDNDRFTLVINSVDKTVASYINKNTQVYNRFGKLLSDSNEIFDLTKDGYPITKLPPLNYLSPNEMFNVVETNDTIKIKQKDSQNKIAITFPDKEIKQIGWPDNSKQVVFLLMDSTKQNIVKKNDITSTLIIYDLKSKKIVKTFESKGYKRFVLIGDLLIFDDGFGRDSFIELFSLNKLNEVRKIKITGGCGLKNIPAL
jgi:hypothetical protein